MTGVPRVKPAERARMRDLRRKGLSFQRIGQIVGRSGACVADHAGDIAVTLLSAKQLDLRAGMRVRAVQQQGYFDRVNRCLAEVQA